MVTHAIPERPLTIDDLMTLPEDGNRYELIGGELIVSPAPSLRHQHLVGEMFKRLSSHVEDRQFGTVFTAPVEVQLTPHDVVQPDIVVVLTERLYRLKEQRIEGAPDLVVEVISPGSRGTDRVRKAALYANHGVREYWLVDPETESVAVQILEAGRFIPMPTEGRRVRSRVLPDFEINVASLFTLPVWMVREGGADA